MAEGPWRQFGKGRIRSLGKGKAEYQRRERPRESREANAEAQKEARRHPRSAETSKEGGRMIAEMTPLQHNEMMRKCGNDPEKHMMFLRDHPEALLVPERQANLPPKRIFSFPKRMRSDR